MNVFSIIMNVVNCWFKMFGGLKFSVGKPRRRADLPGLSITY